MGKDVTEFAGIKYSLQPHGMKSRFLFVFFSFVVVFGGALALASSAQAAGPTQVFVSVCGDNTSWYVNPDEWTKSTADDGQGDRRPLAVSDGLVFSPADLIHHQVDFIVDSSLVAGTYVGNPAPDIADFFSIEVVNDDHTGYGTLRWDDTAKDWEVTKSGVTTASLDPAALLTGLGLSLHARSFGVGYTNSPPGTVASLVSSISFRTTVYKLSCLTVSPSPSPVPGPVKTVFKTVTVTPRPEAVFVPTTEPLNTKTFDPVSESPFPFPTLETSLAAGAGGNSIAGWGAAVALITGTGLLAVGIIGVMRRRKYQGAHSTDGETQVMPAVQGDDDYGVGDYDPSSNDYDPALGGYAGESYQEGHDTEETPTVNTDTKPIPPVE